MKLHFVHGLILLSLDPPMGWGCRGWWIHVKGLLTWENVDETGKHFRHVRRHLL